MRWKMRGGWGPGGESGGDGGWEETPGVAEFGEWWADNDIPIYCAKFSLGPTSTKGCICIGPSESGK